MANDSVEVIYWCISTLILIANVYYIATGPINAVKTGRKLNEEQQKDNSKRTLFLKLFSLRGSPIHPDFVRGLNQIDVVFQDNPDILTAWHTHRTSLHNKGLVNSEEVWNMERANLLSAMAAHLGYPSVKQTDILLNYYPEGHQNQEEADFDSREKWMEYLKTHIELNQLLIVQIKQNNMPPAEESTSTT